MLSVMLSWQQHVLEAGKRTEEVHLGLCDTQSLEQFRVLDGQLDDLHAAGSRAIRVF